MDGENLQHHLSDGNISQQEVCTFNPEPLGDAKTEIRLFFLHPGKEDEQIRLTLRTWRLQDAPTFRAISYTWGPTKPERLIYVDGNKYSVRHNCYYALWQARIHHPCTHIFIDALCINQQDAQEKSAQVQIMGSIFAAALSVLVCVGPHGDDSAFLREFDPFQVDEWAEWAGKNNHAIYERVKLRGFDYCKRFWHVYRAFARRSYWHRLWIIQEIAMARTKQVLCGTDALSWDTIDLIIYCKAELPDNYANDGDDQVWFEDPLWNAGHWAKAEGDDFANMLLTFGSQLCADPRDRIYGLSNLIKWSDDGPAIVADYSISLFDLVVKATRHLEVGYYLQLLSALKVDARNAEMKALAAKRRLAVNTLELCAESERYEDRKLSFVERPFTFLEDRLDQLTCSIQDLNQYEPPDDDYETFQNLQRESGDTQLQNYQPKRLIVGGKVIGLLCHQAQAGDILMSYYYERPHLQLVLRQHDIDGSLTIIGQAMILNGHADHGRLLLGDKDRRYEYRATLTTSLTMEDILVLLGQDLFADESLFSQGVLEPPTIKGEQWALRPLTRVNNTGINPGARAWLQDIRRYDASKFPRTDRSVMSHY